MAKCPGSPGFGRPAGHSRLESVLLLVVVLLVLIVVLLIVVVLELADDHQKYNADDHHL